MSGLYWAPTAEWLPEILAREQWVLEGVEPILGNACAKVSYNSTAEILWLDLEHDGLPRRHLTNAGSTNVDFVVDEFQELDGGLWFPKLGRIQLLNNDNGNVQNQLFVVTMAQVNISLDLTRFQPPKPARGTVVRDGRTGNIQGRSATPEIKERPIN
ncbi:MAG: hypothetical protein RIK87_04465 [Fuerstiella sp.]